jgi:hypothetical protein
MDSNKTKKSKTWVIYYSLLTITIFLIIYWTLNKSVSEKIENTDNIVNYDNEKFQNNLTAFEIKASQSKIKTDSAFLGFKFGMSKKDVESNLNNLEKSGVIQKNDTGSYIYEIPNLETASFKGAFYSNFYQGKLFQCGLVFNSANSELLDSTLINICIGKYGEITFQGTLQSVPGLKPNFYYWFKNNLKITIKSIKNYLIAENSTSIIEYTDVGIERKFLKEDSIIKNEILLQKKESDSLFRDKRNSKLKKVL